MMLWRADGRHSIVTGSRDGCGGYANGRIALAKIPQVNPDVILLDLRNPGNEWLTDFAHHPKNLSAPFGDRVRCDRSFLATQQL